MRDPREAEARALRRAILFLVDSGTGKAHPLALPEQPFDSRLLRASRLFRRSRERYLAQGGTFRPALLTSPRSLSSAELLRNRIEYSPIGSEYVWAATDRLQKKDSGHLLMIRSFASSLFHEQNHRIVWKLIPPPTKSVPALQRYLNFIESLVVAADMALGDELGQRLAGAFYLTGVTYNPGSDLRKELRSRREYRNYLHAALQATYLNLEGFDEPVIRQIIRRLHPHLGDLADRAANRARKIDRQFVDQTNPFWQIRHHREVLRTLHRGRGPFLELPEDPLDHRLVYLWAERWFEAAGI